MSLKNIIGIIGGGTMGSAIVGLLREKGLCARETCCVFEKEAERQEALQELASAAGTLDELMENSDIVILAVKPQDAPELFLEAEKSITSHTVISIMAGVSIATIARGLGTERVIRAMPNMPARIGRGMTVWMAAPRITIPEKNAARAIFLALGEEFEVSSEALIDAATAISGSGPAYLFSLAEALEDAALQFGFSPGERRLLISATLHGASELYAKTRESPTSLRKAVMSKGGATEAALKALDLHRFATMWWRAVKEAHTRAKELNGDRKI